MKRFDTLIPRIWRRVALSLLVGLGLNPVLVAVPEKSIYPEYIISLYEIVKIGYTRLRYEGYNYDEISIKPDGIIAEKVQSHGDFSTKLYSEFATKIDAFEEGKAVGDDAAAIYYKTAAYAKEVNDSEIFNWFTHLLRVEMARVHQPAWVPALNMLTGMGAICGFVAFVVACAVTGPEHMRTSERSKTWLVNGKSAEELEREIMHEQGKIRELERKFLFRTTASLKMKLNPENKWVSFHE